MNRADASHFRAAQLDRQRAIARALTDREYCVATLIRGARGALRWHATTLQGA